MSTCTWRMMFLAGWMGCVGAALVAAPVAKDLTYSTPVLSQRFGFRLSYANPDGGPVTFHLLDAPDGTLEYRPSGLSTFEALATNVAVDVDIWYYSTAATVPGEDRFVWAVRDDQGHASTATAVINLTSNTPITLASQTNTLAVGSVRRQVHQNHVDPDWYQPKRYQLIEAPARGMLEYRPPGAGDVRHPIDTNTWYTGGDGSAWEYTPHGSAAGVDAFVWHVSDGVSTSAPATVAYVLTANTLPKAINQNETVAVGAVRRYFWLNASDPDWYQTRTFQLVTPPTAGWLEYPDGTNWLPVVANEWISTQGWCYTPTNALPGTDAIVWRMSDGLATSATATVSITITANTPPEARHQNITMLVNQARNLSLNYADPDAGQPFAFRLTEPPGHGALDYSVDGAYLPVPTNTYIGSWSWRYTPHPAFVGTDTFQWQVTDGQAESGSGTYTLNITTNTPPVAYGVRAVGPPDTVVHTLPRYVDPDTGQTYTVHIVNPPAHGVAAISGSWFAYTPSSGFTGVDQFTYRVHDGVDDSNEALVRVQVRESDDRAGNLILLIVRDTLYPNISNAVHRLRQDLLAEGYTAAIHTRPSDSTLNLWQHIKSVYDNTGHWLEGVLLIGNLPRPRLNDYHAYHGAYRNMYTDLPLWNMNYYQTEGSALRHDFRIWVGRFYAVGSSYGDEVTLTRRALDANHAARTGKARLPHTAYYYHAWADRADMGEHLTQTWPLVAVTNEVGTSSDKKYKAQFMPWRTEFANKGGADALIAGGDVFQETSHGASGSYMYGKFTTADLFQYISQQRACIIDSCSSGAYGGIANHHILTRGGGTLFAVGGSDINYVGDFQTATEWGDARNVRERLAEGEAWGSALLRHYPFRALNRTLFHGDLSMPAMVSPSNAVPVVESLAKSHSDVYPGQPVTFTITVSDADAEPADSPHVDFDHQVEWFMHGYDAGRREPTYTTSDTQGEAWTTVTHVFTAPGTHRVRAEVMDAWQARGWREMTVTVLPYPMQITSATPATPTFMNAAESLTFAVTATDPSGAGGLSYAWEVDGEPVAGDASSLVWTAPTDVARTCILRVTVSDAWGSSVSHGWTIAVVGHPPPIGPVGYWRLDEESGTRADASGFGNHLTAFGVVGAATGRVNRAALFSGASSDYLAIQDGDQTHLGMRDAFTAAAWIRPGAVDGTRLIMSKYNYGNHQRAWRFQLEGGKLRFHASAAGTDNVNVTGNATLSANHWRHVAVVYASGAVRFYVDGALDRSTSVSVTRLFEASVPFALGANFNGASITQHFQGLIDEARLYRRALSDAEIAALASGGNQSPVAVDDAAVTPLNRPVWIDVLANDGDPDGDALTLTGAGPAAQGVVATTAGPDGVQYTPNPDFTGTDAFAYTIADPHGLAATGTVHVLVVGHVPMTLTPNGTGRGFSFPAAANWKYRVEYRDCLLSVEGWKELFRGVAEADELIHILDDAPCVQRFYRIQVRP